MKEFKKLLHMFDNTYVGREDESNVEESIEVNGGVIQAIFDNTWLLPSVTFNDSYTSRNGTKYIRNYGKFNADVTTLGQDSASTGYAGTKVIPVSIDTKVSTYMGGTFISKGLVSQEEMDNIANEVGPSLAEAWQLDIQAMITADGTPFEYDPAKLETNPAGLLADAKKTYKQANGGKNPTTCIINYDYENILLNFASEKGGAFTPATNDKLLVNGQVGMLQGMLLIPSNIEELFYVYNWQYLHIPLAKDAKDSGDSEYKSKVGSAFSSGDVIQVVSSTNAKAGTGVTYFHLNYGKKLVLPQQFLVATEIVTIPEG